ncbi:MAG: hypothetical protein ACYTGP_11295 [Planctomycetota bacterium]
MNPNESNSLASHDGESTVDEDHSLSTYTDDAFEGGHDPLAGAVSTRKSHTGSILVVAVILVAIAGVFSMRKLAEVTAATGIDREIEATIEQFLGSLTPNGQRKDPDTNEPMNAAREEILAVLGTAYTEIQVPLRDVQRDPFIISDIETPQVNAAEIDPEDLTAQQERRWRELQETRRAELRESAEGFALKAIMGGSSPLAIIDGKTVTKGAFIASPINGEEFEVIEITGTTVKLVARAAEFDVEVEIELMIKR